MAVDQRQDAKRALMAWIDANQEDAVGFLRELVRTKSANPPGREKEVADLCANFARSFGMEVDQFEPEDGRVSNVCRLRGRDDAPVLLFNSHLDTFPPGDETKWKYPPYGAEIHDGIVWGVGARNMKAGLAAALVAAKAVVNSGLTLRGDILLTQTADEIQGGHKGWEMLLQAKDIRADFGVYTEANPPLKIEIAARGLVHFEITVTGYAKHTKYKVEPSTSGVPINAIAKMAKVVDAIESMAFSGWKPHPYVPGPPVISVNRIEGGFSDAMVADHCRIIADCRILPNQSPEEAEADVRRTIARLQAADPDLRVEISVRRTARAVEISADEPIVSHVQDAVREVIGHELPLGGVGSTSDMRWIVLDAGIPMCKFMFPSTESGTNEHESIADYMNTIRVYATLIANVLS